MGYAPSSVDVLRDWGGSLRFSEVLFARERRGSNPRFTDAVLQSGWSTFSGSAWGLSDFPNPAGYMLDSSGIVHLRGMIDPAAGSEGATMFYLPAQARPAYTERQVVYYMGFDSVANAENHDWDSLLVSPTSGAVWMILGTPIVAGQEIGSVSLDGHRFRAAGF